MAQSIAKVLFLATLAIAAFSLQGCGEADTGGDNKAEYKATAATTKAAEEETKDKEGADKNTANDEAQDTPADEVEESGGCPVFQAAVKAEAAHEAMIDKIMTELKAEAACVKDVMSTACAADISQNVADNIIFTVEKDHEFLQWAGKEENKAKWDKVKVGPINEQLLEVFTAVVATLQSKLPAGATMESVTTQDVLDAPSLLREQLTQAIDGTVEAFCPAYEAEVESATKEAEPFAEAEEDKAEAEADAKVEATKEENAVEASTTLAPDVATQAAESTDSTAAVMAPAVTETDAAKTATSTADADAVAAAAAKATADAAAAKAAADAKAAAEAAASTDVAVKK